MLKIKPVSRAIGFSRILGLSDAIALGLSISLGIALTALAPLLMQFAGEDTPLVYALTIIVFIPLVLSYAERAQQVPGSASCYQLAQLSGQSWLVFIVGWLMLAGHVAVAALLTDSIGLRVIGIMKQLFNIDAGILWVLMAIIGVTGVYEFTSARNYSPIRNNLVWLCLLLLFFVLIWAIFKHDPKTADLPPLQQTQNWLSTVAILSASLWGLEAVTSFRRQLRNAAQNLPLAMLGVLVIANLIGVATMIIVIRFPDLTGENLIKQLSWNDSRFVLVILTLSIVICWTGLSRILASGIRLMGVMLNDGFFPRIVERNDGTQPNLIKIAVLLILSLALAFSDIPVAILACIAAITYLWSFLLVIVPHIWQPRSAFSTVHRLKLPLHPFVPVLASVIALYLSLLLSLPVILITLAWIALGGMYYLLYGFRGNAIVQRKKAVVGDQEKLPEKGLYRVLVAVKAGEGVDTLITAGAALAKANHGELLVLHCRLGEKFRSPESIRIAAEKYWRNLNETINAIECPNVSIKPLIRIAPSATVAILETAKEYKVDFIILGSPGAVDELENDPDPVVKQVFYRASFPVAVINGNITEQPLRILVAAEAKPNLNAGLKFTAAFVGEAPTSITVLAKKLEQEQALELTPTRADVNLKQLDGTDITKEIGDQALGTDLLIIGAAVDPAHNRAVFDGIPVELTGEMQNLPSVIVKAKAPIRTRMLGHFSRIVIDQFPTLTISERSEVFSNLGRAARGNVDYYTLLFLSTTIATLGLLLNSGAVIIGAMLVAPLMNPILAVGNGIVLGNFLLIRRGLNSALNGVCLVIMVGTVIVILLPLQEADSEILSRTQPNAFDLMVALAAGAVAAYGVSRKSVAAALPGVAIAVALVPPLCVVGYGLGAARFLVAGGALLLFLTNFAAIIMAGAAVFYVLGFRPSKTIHGALSRRAFTYTICGLLLLSIPLGFATLNAIEKRRIDELISERFELIAASGDARLRDVSISRGHDEYRIHMTVHALDNTQQIKSLTRELREYLEHKTGAKVSIKVTAVSAFEFTENSSH